MLIREAIKPAALPAAFGVWSPAILSQGSRRTLYISGLTARNAEGAVVGVGDYEIQTRQVCENLKATVEAAGGTLDDIVSVTVYVCDVAHFDVIHKVRREYFPKDPPASAMVEVVRLVGAECLIEISAIAELA